MGATVYRVGPTVQVYLADSDGQKEPQPPDVLDRLDEALRLAADEVAKQFICLEQGIDVLVS